MNPDKTGEGSLSTISAKRVQSINGRKMNSKVASILLVMVPMVRNKAPIQATNPSSAVRR
jgi:hypothetical protein